MEDNIRMIDTELCVIGSGLAGVAASIFALNRGLNVAQTGNTGAIAYTTGYLDLLGTSGDRCTFGTDPWEMLRQLRNEVPNHPLSRVRDEEIRDAFSEFTQYISECGITYGRPAEKNIQALTPAGTIKQTMSVPGTMQAGVDAFAGQKRCLILDFKGLRGFSGRQIVANLKRYWPNVSSARIKFPGMSTDELYPEVLARALEVDKNRKLLAAAVKPFVESHEVIGMPAVFGMHKPDRVMSALQELIGVQLFEIPTMPPSVPGIRLREMIEQVFPQKGVTLIAQQKVSNVDLRGDRLKVMLKDNYGPISVHAQNVILATGRFISGGLEARRSGIIEPLLDIPVTQPDSRDEWYHHAYLSGAGHKINRSGIEVDDLFRPLGIDGTPVHNNLYGAGVILAHQDWIRDRCGAGVAITSAYRAVASIVQARNLWKTS